jgi:hydrogenase maturation protease
VTGAALVIGYGNELRGDDGAGFHLARRLAGDPRLDGTRVIARRQLTPELALDISRARLVVFIDASRLLAPGEVSSAAVHAATGTGASGAEAPYSHHMTAEALLGLAAELYGSAPQAMTVSVGVAGTDFGSELSPEVEAAVPQAADEVVRLAGGARDA